MPKTKTVVVDAAELEACRTMVRENPGLAALHQVSVEALTPVVPTLPEGWEVTLSRPDIIKIESGICSASITEDGVIYKVWTGPDRLPHDVATYLLHAWSNR